MRQRIFILVIMAAINSSLSAQNNSIFNGGSDDGFAWSFFQQSATSLNNPIFNGGSADGFSTSSYSEVPIVLSNAIFNGGSSDGFAFIIINNLALPVDLLLFEGFAQANDIQLTWQTATETNNDRFEIERSAATSFEKIGSVKGHGTTVQSHDYRWIDRHPLDGRTYYRLKQIDFSGKASYSNVIAIDKMSTGSKHFQIFPNPIASGKFTIVFTNDISGPVHIHIINNAGKHFFETIINDQTRVELLLPNMIAGTFLITIKTSSFVETAKLVIAK